MLTYRFRFSLQTTDHQSGSFTITTTSTNNPEVHIGQLRPATVIEPSPR